MFKRIPALLLTGVMTFSLAVPAFAATAGDAADIQMPAVEVRVLSAALTNEETETQAASSNFYLNGEPVSQTGMYFVNGILYCSVRAFLEAALPSATVTGTNGQIQVVGSTQAGEALQVTATVGDCYLTANGRCLYVKGNVQNVNGVTMAPASVLASIFGGSVAWNNETGEANVTLGDRLLTSGESFYDAQSLDLLSRIINAEAGNQPMSGKIAVGNVIMNRVNSSRFPNTIYEVVYAKNQFSVVNSGAINRTPNASSVVAAKLTLEGVSILPTALYFNQAGLNCWAARNRDYVATIGGHSFYA